MNRRDFFKGLAAAVVAASAGTYLISEQARHLATYRKSYSLQHDRWWHRFDVRIPNDRRHDNGAVITLTQYQVDLLAQEHLTQEEVEMSLKAFEGAFGMKVSLS